ncbi:hypothetical protein FKM82_013204 [Ascaphus truei]
MHSLLGWQELQLHLVHQSLLCPSPLFITTVSLSSIPYFVSHLFILFVCPVLQLSFPFHLSIASFNSVHDALSSPLSSLPPSHGCDKLWMSVT